MIKSNYSLTRLSTITHCMSGDVEYEFDVYYDESIFFYATEIYENAIDIAGMFCMFGDYKYEYEKVQREKWKLEMYRKVNGK